jgi:hypothetical protein
VTYARGARRLGVAEMPLPCKAGARATQTWKSTPRLHHDFAPPHTPRTSRAEKNTPSKHLESTSESHAIRKLQSKCCSTKIPPLCVRSHPFFNNVHSNMYSSYPNAPPTSSPGAILTPSSASPTPSLRSPNSAPRTSSPSRAHYLNSREHTKPSLRNTTTW